MAHSAWWVGLLQWILLGAALVLSVRAREDAPGAEDLSRGGRLMAAIRLHPWQYGAACLCAVGASVCAVLYYL
jgi:hypothetical protein